ncbi:hypothetical protein E5843_10135 [Luteimonas yindakuii]|uniref:hypothetical protein n=1 Tax=Luteimonas yindakuii TaxID=2565782 RepID=UPI0010A4D731|nr:hypothetical protein [Luteimonas yindakuii]QCO68032.1 hypothetical protein E5843_10135 [Luteimonas yindakuii]
MTRVAFGFLWFVVFLVAAMIIFGVVVAPDTSAHGDAVQSYDAGYAAGYEVGRRYGKVILLGALTLSIAGTVLGWLPGTGRKK